MPRIVHHEGLLSRRDQWLHDVAEVVRALDPPLLVTVPTDLEPASARLLESLGVIVEVIA